MDTMLTKKPKTMAELLPGLGGLLSKTAMKTAIMQTATKKPRTTQKVLHPLTLAEMRTEIQSLQPPRSSKKKMQATASAKKRWNSSCKYEHKTVSHTAKGQMKHNSVRKVLNFQQAKPQPQERKLQSYAYSRIAMLNSETPKFPKPEITAKKSLHLQARDTVRISGICNIPETPVMTDIPTIKITRANKENITNQPDVYKKLIATPKSILRKRVLFSRLPDTPLSNETWNASCDDSFLKNEQDIETKALADEQTLDNIAKVPPPVSTPFAEYRALAYEHTLDNIADVSPPVSTPFAEYRNVNDFFNNSSNMMESTSNNNTIMCFDNTVSNDIKREESVIVSLCDMLKKATVCKTDKYSTELDDLLEVQKQIENNINITEKTLKNIKESQLKSLQYVNKLIQEKKKHQSSEIDKENTFKLIQETKRLQSSENDKENIVIATKESPKDEKQLNSEIIISKPCSVIKTILKSPSYKIPKYCMRKKVTYNSMSKVSGVLTPQKEMGAKARSIYMKMKERNNYLNTPAVKREVLDTPAKTSHNLQKQLDKLYDDN